MNLVEKQPVENQLDLESKPSPLTQVVDAVKKGYFFFEDKYYLVLDKINKYVPVYKVVDPIDKIVPSFILLMALVVLFILLFVVFNPFAPALGFEAILQIEDQGGDTLSGASIRLSSEPFEEDIVDLTDDWGQLKVTLPEEEITATVVVTLEGYETLTREITLTADETKILKLSSEGIDLQPSSEQKTIKLYNSRTGSLLSQDATVEFSCSSNQGDPPSQTRSDGIFRVTPPSNCGLLEATVTSSGFNIKTKYVTMSVTRIDLVPIEVEGKISVTVRNFDGSNAADVRLSLIDSGTGGQVDSGSTASSGTHTFNAVDPGTYSITASPTDEGAAPQTKSGIVVNAGETTPVSIDLPEVLVGKNLFLKIVDSNSDLPVIGATVFFYFNNELLDSKTSDVDGLMRQAISEDENAYIAVVTHTDYLTSVVPRIPIKNLSDQSPYLIKVTRRTRIPPHNRPTIYVKVGDEDNAPVENALVWIYDSDYPEIPLNHVAAKTNADGNYVFESLGPGTYFVKAKKGEAEGQSLPVDAPVGEIVEIDVKLVLGTGKVEVKVYDLKSTSDPDIQNASVEFFDTIDDSVIASCLTDEDGECSSGDIPADKVVYVKASAEGYVPAFGYREIDIINKGKPKLEIGLLPTTSIDPGKKVVVEFDKLCEDEECKNTVDSLESNEEGEGTLTYYARFNLILSVDDPDNLYSEIWQHVRVSDNWIGRKPDTLPTRDYLLKIKGALAPSAKSILFSSCWDETSNFSVPTEQECPDNQAYKMLKAAWGELWRIVIPVTVRFLVEDGLEEGKEVKIYYQARADHNGETIQTPEKAKIFIIGEVLCAGKKFAWRLSLKNIETGISERIFAGEEYDISVSSRHRLDYWIYNCSVTRDWENATLTAENDHPNPVKPIQLTDSTWAPVETPLEVFSRNFPRDTDLNSEAGDVGAIHFFTLLETGGSYTDFVLNINASNMPSTTEDDGHERIIKFNIVADGNMQFADLPQMLSEVVVGQDLYGRIVDKETGLPIENANLELEISEEDVRPASGPTTAAGLFSFSNLPLLSGIPRVKLRASKAGYASLSIWINVGTMSVVWSPDFKCIDVDDNRMYLRRDLASSDTFEVVSDDCNRKVEIMLESELIVTSPSGQIFEMLGTDIQPVGVRAELPPNNPGYPLGIGEYYVHIRARFDENDDGRFNAADGPYSAPLKKVRVFITDPTSCFRLANPDDTLRSNCPNSSIEDCAKSSFDIQVDIDNGLIINECFKYIEDIELPMVETIRVHGTNPEVFSIEMPELLRDPPIKVLKTFIPSDLKVTGTFPVNITPDQGTVSLQWVDFYMTDLNHDKGDRHRVWAQIQRDGCSEAPANSVLGDCFNITGQYPHTIATGDSLLPHAVVTNSNDAFDDGWVDTDTYHPPDAVYSTQVTTAPIWQASHNICNATGGVECAVPNMPNSRPYFAAKNADQFILEVEGDNTLVRQINWEYWNYDIDHEGVISFDLVNQSVSGETYALLKATDTVTSESIPENDPVDFGWKVKAWGSNETVEREEMPSAWTYPLASMRVLGISANSSSNPRIGVYDFNADLALTFANNPSVLDHDQQFKNLVVGLGGTDLNITALGITATGDCTDKVFVFYHTSTWNFGLIGQGPDCVGGDCAIDFVSPKKINAYAIVNEGDCTLSIDNFSQDLHSKTDNVLLGEDSNTNTIPANSNQLIIESFSIPIENPEDYDTIIYTVESAVEPGTQEVNVFFEGSEDPLNTEDPNASLIAMISSREISRVLGEEYFHIRLIGEKQTDCYAYDGTFGVTGEKNKPRVRFNWNWNEITPDTCTTDNPDYIYCDATQFTISLLHRIEAIRALAEDGVETNLDEIHRLRTFNAYLMQDSFTPDLRSDLKQFLLFETFEQDPQETLLSNDHPWQEYLEHSGDYLGLVFNQTSFTAGVYEVFISFNFDAGREVGFKDFEFFHGSCGETCDDVDLLGTINLTFRKKADPPVNNPLYRLPINGTVGKTSSGYDRQGYGIGFDNSGNVGQAPIIIVGDLGDPVVVAEAESTAGTVDVILMDSFPVINNINRGEIFSITRNPTSGDPEAIVFSPSIATPILLEIESANDKAEAFYYLRTPNGNLLPATGGIMNLWTGVGSTMGEHPNDCTEFNNAELPYRQRDYEAGTDSCVKFAQNDAIFLKSHGFNYTSAPNGEKIFFETIFFVPASRDSEDVVLHNSCPASAISKFYSPDEPLGSPQIGLSNTTGYRTVSVQNVIDLVGQGYVCVSDDSVKLSFWWNPQGLLKRLDEVKETIPNWDDEENGLRCNVSPFGRALPTASN